MLNNMPVDVDTRVYLASNDDKRLRNKSKSTASRSSAAGTTTYHRVKSGQNLSTIAAQYKVEVQDLKVWNNLKGSVLVPGQRLIVSSKASPQKKSTARSKTYISYKPRRANEGSGKI